MPFGDTYSDSSVIFAGSCGAVFAFCSLQQPVQLCCVVTRLNSDQVHAEMFQPKNIPDRFGVPNGIFVELVDVFDFTRLADGFGS